MTKVLVCEDELAIREFIVLNLERAGYETYAASSGEEALEFFEKKRREIEIAILDVMLPGIDGYTVCEKIRSSSGMGIIMLTAKTQEEDKIRGLRLGADDYITKPFSPSELVARVEAIQRRMKSNMNTSGSTIILGEFELNPKNRTLTRNGKPIDITQTESQVLELLMSNAGKPLSRDEILKEVWNDSNGGEEKIVDVNIRRIRMKIEDNPSYPKHIQTVWGCGYKWTE